MKKTTIHCMAVILGCLLLSLHTNARPLPFKMANCKAPSKAAYFDVFYGDIFGGGYDIALQQGDNYLYMPSINNNYYDIQIYNDSPEGVFTNGYWERISGPLPESSGNHWLELMFSGINTDAEYNFHYTDDTGEHILYFHFIGTNTPPSSLR